MQLPSNIKEREKLCAAIRDLKGDPKFELFMTWIRTELHSRDVQNRNMGYENQESAAKALADIDTIVAASQAPEVDRNENKEPGAESIMSAEPRI